MPNKYVHNLIILDESGSMNAIKDATISGFNELAQTIIGTEQKEPDLKQAVTMVSFNGLGIKTLLSNVAPQELAELDAKRYQPNASTPLFDAMGFAINLVKSLITELDDVTVLVTIFTDGMENASKEYRRPAIKAMIEELSNGGWTFTYIGANHDVHAAAKGLSIQNFLTYDATEDGVKVAMQVDASSRSMYYAKRAKGKIRKDSKAESNYFSEQDDQKA